jgi:hypothetical protein
METLGPQKKTFWERPEGKTGMIFGLLLLCGLGWGFFLLLPTLLALAFNTVYLMGMIAAIGVLAYVIIDPSLRNILKAGYQVLMRGITGLVISIDPIAIMKGYAQDIQSHLAEMDKQLANLRGKKESLKNTIDANAAEMDKSLKLASKAKEVGKSQITVLKTRQAGRLKESNMTLQELHTKMEKLYQMLLKMYDAGNFMLADITDQIKVKEKEYNSLKTASGAFRSAVKALNGNPDQLALCQQSMEFIADDMGERMGEIEHFMQMSTNFLDSVDLQNGVYQEEGLSLLEQWEKKSDSLLLLGPEKTPLSIESSDVREPAKAKYRKILEE